MNQLALISLVVLSSTLSASAGLFEKCPPITDIDGNFTLDRYLGTWYEIKRTDLIFELGQRCVKAEYKIDSNGKVAVNNSGVSLLNTEVSVVGTAQPGSKPNVFAVNFFPFTPSAQYWVVDTDFENYSLVVSCNEVFGFFATKNAWILSRKPTLDEAIITRLVSKLETLGIEASRLTKTVQNC